MSATWPPDGVEMETVTIQISKDAADFIRTLTGGEDQSYCFDEVAFEFLRSGMISFHEFNIQRNAEKLTVN